MKLLFEHPLISVWFHERQKVVHHRVSRPILSEELDVVKAAFTSGTEILKKHKATKWLSDDKHQLVMPADVQEWCQQIWFPTTRSLGWQYWALILPESAVARLFMARMVQGVSAQGLIVHTFTQVPDALTWLAQIDSRANSGT